MQFKDGILTFGFRWPAWLGFRDLTERAERHGKAGRSWRWLRGIVEVQAVAERVVAPPQVVHDGAEVLHVRLGLGKEIWWEWKVDGCNLVLIAHVDPAPEEGQPDRRAGGAC